MTITINEYFDFFEEKKNDIKKKLCKHYLIYLKDGITEFDTVKI